MRLNLFWKIFISFWLVTGMIILMSISLTRALIETRKVTDHLSEKELRWMVEIKNKLQNNQQTRYIFNNIPGGVRVIKRPKDGNKEARFIPTKRGRGRGRDQGQRPHSPSPSLTDPGFFADDRRRPAHKPPQLPNENPFMWTKEESLVLLKKIDWQLETQQINKNNMLYTIIRMDLPEKTELIHTTNQQFATNQDLFNYYVVFKKPMSFILQVRKHRELLFLFSLILSGVICWLLARWISNQIKSIANTTRAFSQGDLNARAPDKTNWFKDEITDLFMDFNHMADQILDLIQGQERLLKDVSHELRTPLTRMSLALENLRADPDDEKMIHHIEKDIHRLDALIQNLLQLPKIYNEIIAVKTLDFRQWISQIIDSNQLIATHQGVHINANKNFIGKSRRTDIKISANETWLRSAIENLIQNALRYSPENSSIDIDWNLDRQRLNIKIRDRGPGVAEKDLKKIFQPFFRANPDRDRTSGGVGLGLAIVHQVITSMGGNIKAENAHPGLLMKIQLPVKNQEK